MIGKDLVTLGREWAEEPAPRHSGCKGWPLGRAGADGVNLMQNHCDETLAAQLQANFDEQAVDNILWSLNCK